VNLIAVEQGRVCLLNPKNVAQAAFDGILEVSVNRSEINLKGQKTCASASRSGTAACRGRASCGRFLEIPLGDEQHSWPLVE